MKKRMLSILLALAMALALLPGTALAFTQPPDTDFWVGLSREQVTDIVIVTPYYALEAIKKDLSGKVACPVVSIEEVVWSV